jgi:hypothetical protein
MQKHTIACPTSAGSIKNLLMIVQTCFAPTDEMSLHSFGVTFKGSFRSVLTKI